MEDSGMKTSTEILEFTFQVANQHSWRWLNEVIQEKNFNGSIKRIVPRNTEHSPTFSFTGEIDILTYSILLPKTAYSAGNFCSGCYSRNFVSFPAQLISQALSGSTLCP